jgi:NRPS condensation-like uncharacterized protein
MTDRILYAQSRMYEPHIHAVISFQGRINKDRMGRAVRLSLEAEPVLGCRFVVRWWRPYWERRDDLDELELCGVVETEDVETELQRFLAMPTDPCKDPQVLAHILRAENDTLCIKLNHMTADAGGTKEYVCLLAALYRKLTEDPGYVPRPNLKGSRSFRQVSRRFGFLDMLRIVGCGLRDTIEDTFPLRSWTFPAAQGLPEKRSYVIRRIGSERFRALKAFGDRHRATVNDVVVAALYRALLLRIHPAPGEALRMVTTADLRRYLPSEKAGALCNLSGFVHLNPGVEMGKTLEDATIRIRDLMNRKKASYLGLGDYPFAALVFKGLPFAWARRLLYRAIDLLSKPGAAWPGLTNLGVLRPQELVFGGPEVTDAFLTAPIPFPPLVVLGVSGFRESLTFSLGICETGMDRAATESFFELLERCMP